MADPRGFLTVPGRQEVRSRPVEVRLRDWKDVHDKLDEGQPWIKDQASRCMDCGVPFCQTGCPLGNIMPEFNDLVYRGQWDQAVERIHVTNNFPEFTGRVCPAPCESACVLGIHCPPVTIKSIEQAIADAEYDRGLMAPHIPERLTGATVAVVGSGPAGLAAAQQLTRAGHTVVVYERDDAVGGLLRYGIPDFKLEKHLIDRRIEQMQAEGTRFRTGVTIGTDITWDTLRRRYDAIVVAIGSTRPRDLPLPGRDLGGVHFAMDFLKPANRRVAGRLVAADAPQAQGKNVVVIGGGDTASDCVGTALRQGAASVTSLEVTPRPPADRPDNQPWPTYPMSLRISSSFEEAFDQGGKREFMASTVEYLSDGQGHVAGLRVAESLLGPDGRLGTKPGSEHFIPADMVLLAIGFAGPEADVLTSQLAVTTQAGGVISRDSTYASNVPGVFVAGDAGRGQSLVVWAIAEGRSCAQAVDAYLSGHSDLPAPVTPNTFALRR